MSALPEIVVSAADRTVAAAFIDDLIGTEGEACEGDSADTTRMWNMHTKYYRARVRVRARLDVPVEAEPDEALVAADAHVVYLTESECVSGAAVECRADHGPAIEVRVVACDVTAAGLSHELWAAARKHHYELVPLRQGDDDDDEVWGLGAVRDALYAHLWGNLQRLDNGSTNMANCAVATDELQWSDDSEGDDDSSRNMDLIAALRALGGVRAEGERARGGEAEWAAGREGRLQRAEGVLRAFTRGLR